MQEETNKKLNNKKNISEPKRRSSVLTMQISNQVFIALLIIIVFLVSLLAYFLFIKNIKKELDSVKNNLLTIRQEEYENINNKYIDLLATNKAFKEVSLKDIQKSRLALPQQANLPDIIVMLENITQSNGFAIDSLGFSIIDQAGKTILQSQNLASRNLTRSEKLDKEVLEKIINQEIEKIGNFSKGNLRIISIDLEISQGGYSGFKGLIKKIENSLRLFDIDNFKFSTVDEKLNIKLSSYYLINKDKDEEQDTKNN